MGDQQTLRLVAVGIGCRRGCPAEDIVALVRAALAELPEGARAAGLYTINEKRGEAGLAEAAALLGLPLAFLDAAALHRVAGEARSRSPRVEAMFALPGIAETAALAGAGEGARLLVPRRASPMATCAVAGPAGRSAD